MQGRAGTNQHCGTFLAGTFKFVEDESQELYDSFLNTTDGLAFFQKKPFPIKAQFDCIQFLHPKILVCIWCKKSEMWCVFPSWHREITALGDNKMQVHVKICKMYENEMLG